MNADHAIADIIDQIVKGRVERIADQGHLWGDLQIGMIARIKRLERTSRSAGVRIHWIDQPREMAKGDLHKILVTLIRWTWHFYSSARG